MTAAELTYGDPMCSKESAPSDGQHPEAGEVYRAGPATAVASDGVDFRLADSWGVHGVRLEVDWPLGNIDPEFRRSGPLWSLRLPRPAVDRFEYQFTVRSDGNTAWITDPGNPAVVGNPFGAKSEIRFPEYREPSWLAGAVGGRRRPVPTGRGGLDAPVPVTLWSPDGLEPATTAPLLLAHDGSDMADRGSLLRWATDIAGARPFRVALLDPAAGHRDQWYAASPEYADHLAAVVLPALRETVAVGRTVGLGASLGALSMLHLQRRHPDLLDALALQSGSFFTRRSDPQEARYGRFEHICAAVSEVTTGPAGKPVPVLMTCGTVEENRANNEEMAAVLQAQHYELDMRLVRDAHTMIGWRDGWAPGLQRLLHTVR